MIDNTRYFEVKERLVDNVVIISIQQIKGYTSKRDLKSQFKKIEESLGKIMV